MADASAVHRSFLRVLPEGFHTAVEHLIRIPLKVIVDTCEKIIRYVLHFGEGCRASDTHLLLSAFELDDPLSLADVENVLNLLLHVFRTAFNLSVSPQAFQAALRRQSQMSVVVVKILLTEYVKYLKISQASSQPEEAEGESQQPSDSPGMVAFELWRLRKMDWKLGVGIASDECEKLNSGKVVLTFSLDSKAGHKVERHTVELTLGQFRSLFAHFREMKEVFDTL